MSENADSIKQMLNEIGGFVNDLTEALKLKTGVCKRYGRIVFCGMGASAIGGEIIADAMYYASPIPVVVVKTPSMQYCADQDSLVVVCSYSGDTMESVEMYEAARNKGLDVIVVARGGRLTDLSKKNGNKIVKIGGEPIQPRSAIGWFIGILGGIVEDAGGPKFRTELKASIGSISSFIKELESEGSISRRIARAVDGKIPAIYAVPDLSMAAIRWKTQFNENSKLISFAGVIPEFNHNEVVGWCADVQRDKFIFIILDDGASKVVSDALYGTRMALKDAGVNLLNVDIVGDCPLERIIKALLIGDYVSLFLAEHLGKDPCEVNTIKQLKRRIREKQATGNKTL